MSCCGLFGNRDVLVRPEFVIAAAKRKYRTNSSSILGAIKSDVDWFWSLGSLLALSIDPPREVGRYVVDQEVKQVFNDGTKPREVEINTLHAPSQSKTYRLSPSKYVVFGDKLSGYITPDFFQMVPINLAPSNYEGTTLKLSKGYGATSKVFLPPMSMVTATIITRAIAFQATSHVRVSFPRYVRVGIKRKKCLGCCTVLCDLTSRELLVYNGVEDVQVNDTEVYFREHRTLSYVGELVEMRVSEPMLLQPEKMPYDETADNPARITLIDTAR